jgi:hypothetical protein
MGFDIILKDGTKDSVLKSKNNENIFNCDQVKSIEFKNGAVYFECRNGKIYSTTPAQLSLQPNA